MKLIEIHKATARSPLSQRLRPQIFAVFSFRYDSHLVPDLVENIRPFVDGWVSFDDRLATETFSSETRRRNVLLSAAIAAGAQWILAIDPDERLEYKAVGRLHRLVVRRQNVAWNFCLQELYSPSSYRVDGIWGKKKVARLFPAKPPDISESRALHGDWFKRGSLKIKDSGLNLYHLKMIAPVRRNARRELYNALDPEKKFQQMGYDYLADEIGAKFENIPPGRHYEPVHLDDQQLWMAKI